MKHLYKVNICVAIGICSTVVGMDLLVGTDRRKEFRIQVQKILDQKGDINAPLARYGYIAPIMHLAHDERDYALLMQALVQGAYPTVVHPLSNYITPLHTTCDSYAQPRPNTKSAVLLLEHGANVDYKSTHWAAVTPLMVAVKQGYYAAVKLFLEHKANPNIRDNNNGWTALMYAINGLKGYVKGRPGTPELTELNVLSPEERHVRLAIIKLLLYHGANPFMPNKEGKNSSMLAQEYNLPELVKLFTCVQQRLIARLTSVLSRGSCTPFIKDVARIIAQYRYSYCSLDMYKDRDQLMLDQALLQAAAAGDKVRCQELVDLGASLLVTIGDKEGVLTAAVKYNHTELVRWLLDLISAQDLQSQLPTALLLGQHTPVINELLVPYARSVGILPPGWVTYTKFKKDAI